jgi:hypothetical protein
MDALVELVVEKTGISDAQARKAVETILDFLKEKLPSPIGDNLDNLLEGADNLDLDKGLDLLGGLLGKK